MAKKKKCCAKFIKKGKYCSRCPAAGECELQGEVRQVKAKKKKKKKKKAKKKNKKKE